MSSSTSAWHEGRRAASVQLAGLVVTLGVWAVAEQVGRKVEALGVLVVLWTGWFAWRAWREPDLWRRWGLIAVPWRRHVRPYALVTAILVTAAAVLAWLLDHWTFPASLWIILLLYPVWALLQQFILQNGVIDSLHQLGLPRRLLPLAGGAAFGIAHLPDLPLAGLTGVGGVLWTYLWLHHRNLWLLALSHAVAGTLAFVWILGRDPAGEFPSLAALL